MREIFIKVPILTGKSVKYDDSIRSCIGPAYSRGVPHFQQLVEGASPCAVPSLADCAALAKRVAEVTSLRFTRKVLGTVDLSI
jgi:hypothetical protein